MAEFSIDTTQVRALAADLSRAPLVITGLQRAALEVTARKVKDEARALISGLAHAPSYPQSIGYQVRMNPTGGEAEIGPTVGGPQWGLGDILEYGTPKSGPHPHLGPALDHNTADFLIGVGLAAQQSLGIR